MGVQVARLCWLPVRAALAAIFVAHICCPSWAQTTPGATERFDSKILSQYSNAAVFVAVRGDKSGGEEVWEFGTGYVVSANGYVITSAHLLLDDSQKPYTVVKVLGSLGTNFDPEIPTGFIYPLTVLRLD